MSRNTVKTIVRRSKEVPTATTHAIGKRNGRKLKTLLENYGHLTNYVRKRNKEPLYAIAVQYRAIGGQTLSPRAIRWYLQMNGMIIYVAAFKPYLPSKHLAARLNWCTTTQNRKQRNRVLLRLLISHHLHCVLQRTIYEFGEKLIPVTKL